MDGHVAGLREIYGSDDDTLFRLITLGTGSLSPGDAFQKQGFVRKGSESVVGPMPPYGEIITRENDIWKIIAWIRSKNCERTLRDADVSASIWSRRRRTDVSN